MKTWSFVLVTAFLSATAVVLAQPSEPVMPSEKLTPKVEARLLLTQKGGHTYEGGSVGGGLAAEEETQLLIAAGFRDAGRGGAPHCTYQMGGVMPQEPAPGPTFLWKIDSRLVDLRDERVTLAYRWARLRTDVEAGTADDWPREVASGGGTVVLNHGQYRILDRVELEVPEGFECFFESLMVTLSAEVAGAPELAQNPSRLEVWLLYDEAGGPGKVLSQQLEGRQGEALGFDFEARRWEVPEVRGEDGDTARVELRISGNVRSWWTAEEELLVIVHTRSVLRKSFSAMSHTESSASVGRKRFVVRPGETVKIVIPPPSEPARLYIASWTGDLPEGLERDGEYLLLPIHEDMASDELSLLLRASP